MKKISYWEAPMLQRHVTLDKVVDDLCKQLDTTIKELRSLNRVSELVEKRHIFLYVLRRYLNLNLKQAGEIINRTHATTVHSVNQAENWKLITDKFDKYKYIKII